MDRRRMLMSQEKSILPSGYVQCEYLESSGKQWIDTRYVFSNNMKFMCQLSATSNIDDNYITGYYYPRQKLFICGFYQKQFIIGIGNNQSNIKSVTLNKLYNYECSITPTSIIAKIDGETYNTIDTYPLDISTKKIYLFARNSNGSVSHYAHVKLSYAIYMFNDVLTLQLIPCYRQSDNKPGMYDTVSGQFFTNQGTGEFGYKRLDTGEVVAPV